MSDESDAAGDAGVPRRHVHRRRLVMSHERVDDQRFVFRTTLEVFDQAEKERDGNDHQ